MGAPPGGPPGAAGGGGAAEAKKQAQMWLIIAVVSWFLCGNGCFGIIGGIFAFLGMQAADQGNIEEAEKKTKLAKMLVIIGQVLVVVLVIIYVLVMFVFGAGMAMTAP